MRSRLLTRLAFLFAAPFLLIGCGDRSGSGDLLTVTGSSTVAPVVADAANRYEAANPGTRIDVQTGGSSRGISDVRTGLAELGMISRELKAEESDLTAHRIAVDGVCMIVHADNPVADLGKRELIEIYTGRTTNWSALGGADAEIVVVNKAEGRATLEVFLGYTGLDVADVQADVIVGENQHAIKTVAGNPQAIGYVSIGAAASEAEGGTPIRLVACEGIAPTAASVAAGEFPITRPLQVVTRGEPSAGAAAFLAYLRSPEVNDIIRTHLYVPVAGE